MGKIFIIGIGGFIGTVARYALSGFIQEWTKSISFPYGTIVVNLAGCFLIGFLSQLADSRGMFGPETRLFLFIGMLGAFTTYSTFGNETVYLLRDGENSLALINIGGHVVLGLACVWLGRASAFMIWR